MIRQLQARNTSHKDIDGIIALFTEEGSNPYGWDRDKWLHYYMRYPDGEPVSLVVSESGSIIGHYGLLPVLISGWPVMLGLHAYVSKRYRGLSVISALMEGVDLVCQERGFAAVCGFANPGFSLIKQTLFKWRTVVWLGFDSNLVWDDLHLAIPGELRFDYTDSWYTWRFGEKRDIYLSDYKDNMGVLSIQLLKVRRPLQVIKNNQLQGIQGWSKKLSFADCPSSISSQPFSIKVFDRLFVDSGAYDYRNWKIDMGDSDTFIYKRSEHFI